MPRPKECAKKFQKGSPEYKKCVAYVDQKKSQKQQEKPAPKGPMPMGGGY